MAYSADSVALFGDIFLRDDGQLNWKPGMLEFNFQLTEVRILQEKQRETASALSLLFAAAWCCVLRRQLK